MAYRYRLRSFTLDATRTLVWTVILAVIATGIGAFWLVRGAETDHIVNRGAGMVVQPRIDCTDDFSNAGRTCTRDVTVVIRATGTAMKQSDVNGLYARAESSPDETLDVQAVYFDTTTGQVNRVVYGGTTYRLEESQGSTLLIGIVATIIGLTAVVFAVYLIRRRRTRAPSPAEGGTVAASPA